MVHRFSFSFLPKGGRQNKMCELLGRDKYVFVMWQTRGVWGHALLGNFDFGPFNRCNLVESRTVFTQT